MAQNGTGPFSQYLTQAYQPTTPKPTGYESGSTGIMHIASSFLDGLRQGRLHRLAMQEKEKESNEKAYLHAIDTIASQADLDPAIKQKHINALQTGYLMNVAGQKETSKDTGHPFTDAIKNFAVNMIGGQAPKKGHALDMNAYTAAMKDVQNPENRVSFKLAKLNSDLADLATVNGIRDQRTLSANPRFSEIMSEWYRLAGDKRQPDFLASLAPDPLSDLKEKTLMQGWKEMSSSAPIPTATGPQVNQPSVWEARNAVQSKMAKAKAIGYPNSLVEPKVGTTPITATWEGQTTPSKLTHVEGLDAYGFPTGYYSDAGKLVRNYTVAAPHNPNSGRQLMMVRQGGPDSPEQAVMVDKATGTSSPVTGPGGNPLFNYDKPTMQLGTFQNPDGSEYQAPVTLWRPTTPTASAAPPTAPGSPAAPLASTPSTSMSAFAASLPPHGDKKPVRPFNAAAPTAPNPQVAPPANVSTTPNNPQVTAPVRGGLRKQPTVPPEDVLNSIVDDLAAGNTGMQQFRQENSDALAQRTILSRLRGMNFRPLNNDNVKRLSTITGVANEFIPAYQNMIRLLPKEKNPQLQWIEGRLSNTFTNPELAASVNKINGFISNFGRGLAGEMRGITDADALRLMGVGPQKEFTVNLNEKLLRQFEDSLITATNSELPGISLDQLKRIAKSRGGSYENILNRYIQSKQPNRLDSAPPDPFSGNPQPTQQKQRPALAPL